MESDIMNPVLLKRIEGKKRELGSCIFLSSAIGLQKVIIGEEYENHRSKDFEAHLQI